MGNLLKVLRKQFIGGTFTVLELDNEIQSICNKVENDEVYFNSILEGDTTDYLESASFVFIESENMSIIVEFEVLGKISKPVNEEDVLNNMLIELKVTNIELV